MSSGARAHCMATEYAAALRELLEGLIRLGTTNPGGGPCRGAIVRVGARFIAATRDLPLTNRDITTLLHSLEIGSYRTEACLARREREVRALIAAAAALIVKLEAEKN